MNQVEFFFEKNIRYLTKGLFTHPKPNPYLIVYFLHFLRFVSSFHIPTYFILGKKILRREGRWCWFGVHNWARPDTISFFELPKRQARLFREKSRCSLRASSRPAEEVLPVNKASEPDKLALLTLACNSKKPEVVRYHQRATVLFGLLVVVLASPTKSLPVPNKSEMECPGSPIRSPVSYQEQLSNTILQQERLHAESKKPRRTRFVQEADSRIQSISETVLQIRKRVLTIHTHFKSLETKINRLDVIKEQACFFMSPKRVLSTVMRSPMKLTYYSPPELIAEGHVSPTQVKLVEFLRRRKLAGIHLSKVWNRLNCEKKLLGAIFDTNINILRFKRAEKCLIKMISLQSRLKTLGKEFEVLEERLFFDDDSNNSTEEDCSF
ncbi:unnamed protein product [Orchesella dallaii]|uniref:Uncharacterized protein n=1 Tax=Orchesella dallaii TaxID=48710 RepID=A0ABP1RAX6_9HEXA